MLTKLSYFIDIWNLIIVETVIEKLIDEKSIIKRAHAPENSEL